ncbi:MAG: acetoacetate decarboxylase family protein [Myxococcota bacterium]
MFEDAEFVSARVEVDPERARAVLPMGLRWMRPTAATVFLARFPKTSFGSVYNEAGLFLHLPMGALHCPWIIVDDDVALITGREILGYPKKLGEIALELGPDGAVGHASRRGARILEVSARFHEELRPPPPVEGRPTFNVAGGLGLMPQRVVAFWPNEEIVVARRAEVELVIGRSERDPIHELGLGRVLEGHYRRLHLGGRALPLPVFPVSPLYWLRNWQLRTH